MSRNLNRGTYGAWLNPVDDDACRIGYAAEAEQLGYGTVWLGLGQRDESDLRLVEQVLDAGGVPNQRCVLAALGPRALRLAAARGAGSHPYLTVPAHTREARRLLGPGPLLAPEQTVVVEPDPVEARGRGRAFVDDPYLRRSNHVNNLLRHGYEEVDVANGGSDRLIDDLVPHGGPDAVAAAVRAQLAAGADHVAIQVLPAPGDGPMPGLRAIAGEMGLPGTIPPVKLEDGRSLCDSGAAGTVRQPPPR